MRPRLATALSTSVLAILLAACGGGGSSGDGSSVLMLDAANHVGAGQAALATGLQFEESSELIVGAQVQRQDDGALLELALDALRRVGPALSSSPPLATGVVITSTVRCDNAEGSYVLAVDDADHDNRFDAGDTATFTFTNCVLDGDAANGKVAIRVNALSGDLDGSVYDGRFTVTMTALSLTGASGSYTGNGALDVDLVGTAARTGSSRVATSGFTSTGRFGSVQSTRTITRFTVNESHVPEGAGERRTLRFEGTLSSTGLEGRSISVATTTPFVVAAGSLYPAQGQAVVSGAFGSTLRLTAVDATSVRFELDANGDGQYEQTSTRPWSELL
jgi:hypothetical protein